MVVTSASKSQGSRRKRDTVITLDRQTPRSPEADAVEADPSSLQEPAELEVQEVPGGLWRYQPVAAAFYQDLRVQVFVACLIGGNFLCNIVEKQIDPKGDRYPGAFSMFELFFNAAFTVELGINMYAYWLCRFWRSGWNIFDFIVVSIGLATTLKIPLPGPFTMLRMMRAFRVFRLFKRVKSLNKIMMALARAVPGVMNAFLILLIVMSIYAILAVELFMDYGKDGTFKNKNGVSISLKSARGLDFGEEYFGYFSASLYTMFQVLTGESWSEAVARPLLFGESIGLRLISLAFFSSFVLINGVVLINVVVAVLLEKMVDEDPAEPAEGGESQLENKSNDGAEDAAVPEPPAAGSQDDDIKDKLERMNQSMAQMAEVMAKLTQDIDSVKPQLSCILAHLQGQGLRTWDVASRTWTYSTSIWMFGLTKCLLLVRLL